MAGNHSQISQQYSTFLQENKNLLTTVTLDPWAKISNENSEYWGVIHECEKPVLSERCYVHYTSSSLDRYIIYEDYHECAHHEWLLLPGFPLLDQKLLIGECITSRESIPFSSCLFYSTACHYFRN